MYLCRPAEEVVFGHKLSNFYMAECTVDDLYLLMGKELNTLDSVPAGNILGNVFLNKSLFLFVVNLIFFSVMFLIIFNITYLC